MPPNERTGGDENFDRMFVAMATDATGAPRFDYGRFGIVLNPLDPNPNGNLPAKAGVADSGSYNPTTGEIRIVISKSKLRAIDGGNTRYQANSDLLATNVRTYYNRPDYQPDAQQPVVAPRAQNNANDVTGDASYQLRGNAFCAVGPELLRAFSRKTHGASGDFAVRLFPQSTIGVTPSEPRRGGTPGDHQIVMVFPVPVTFTGATASGGNATTNPAPNSAPVSEVTINVTNVPNDQILTVGLENVSTGGAPANVSVQMRVLLGDTNNDGAVNSGDAQQTRNRSGQVTDADNFLSDVNLDGSVNSGDAFIVRSQSGTGGQ
jgi:hypothetical protein